MNTPSEEPTQNAQGTRGAELEQEQSRLREELTKGRAERAPAEEKQAKPQTRTRPRESSRRKMLARGLGVAAVASAGAGALLELSNGTAQAVPTHPQDRASLPAAQQARRRSRPPAATEPTAWMPAVTAAPASTAPAAAA
jgi:uncharacterized protein YPO0396